MAEVLNKDKIMSMSEQEWQAFRLEKWQETCLKNSGPMPEWFLANKDSYLTFLEKMDPSKLKVSIEEIKQFTPEQWQQFRQKKWAEKIAAYQDNQHVPSWYMRERIRYSRIVEKKK